MTPVRPVPLVYSELAAAIDGGVYPWERSWIDFKKRLYPDDQADQAGRAKASIELAKDLASMAVHGGYLIYGVAEDKTRHLFTADVMNLPIGLHETVDAIARSRITPPLTVTPTLVSEPGTTRGFLVVEIPPSPDAPHMAESIYWGRSETGKVRLTDVEVERLIQVRGRRDEKLQAEMRVTADADPAPSSQYCHFYFTAIPATGWPDMFARYARDRRARMELSQFCTRLLNEIVKASGQRPAVVAFGDMINNWRGHVTAAGWLGTWTVNAQENAGRALVVDDDGPVRYLNLGISRRLTIGDVLLVCELNVLYETWDMVRLVAALSDEIGYRGGWLLGVELDHLDGHMSQVHDPFQGWVAGAGITWETSSYSLTTKATAVEVREKPEMVSSRMLRRLLRGLGTESVLDQPPFASA